MEAEPVTLENIAILGVLLVGWAFAIWGVVLAVKTVVRIAALEWLSSLWTRTRDAAGFVVGAASGAVIFPLLLALAGVTIPAEFADATRWLGAFLGIGAGGVAGKMHDLVLWKLENWIRGEGKSPPTG